MDNLPKTQVKNNIKTLLIIMRIKKKQAKELLSLYRFSLFLQNFQLIQKVLKFKLHHLNLRYFYGNWEGWKKRAESRFIDSIIFKTIYLDHEQPWIIMKDILRKSNKVLKLPKWIANTLPAFHSHFLDPRGGLKPPLSHQNGWLASSHTCSRILASSGVFGSIVGVWVLTWA